MHSSSKSQPARKLSLWDVFRRRRRLSGGICLSLNGVPLLVLDWTLGLPSRVLLQGGGHRRRQSEIIDCHQTQSSSKVRHHSPPNHEIWGHWTAHAGPAAQWTRCTPVESRLTCNISTGGRPLWSQTKHATAADMARLWEPVLILSWDSSAGSHKGKSQLCPSSFTTFNPSMYMHTYEGLDKAHIWKYQLNFSQAGPIVRNEDVLLLFL